MGVISRAEMRDLRDKKNYGQHNEERAAQQERVRDQQRAALLLAQQKRDESLLNATNKIIEGRATETELNFIISELHAWQQILLKTNAEQARSLIDNQFSFPSKIQKTLQLFLPLLKMKTFTFIDGLIQRTQLINLLSLAQDALIVNGSQSPRPNLLFIAQLTTFVTKIGEEALNEKQTLCLQRLVHDYQINLLGTHNLVEDTLISQLLASITLSQLTSKNTVSQGRDTFTSVTSLSDIVSFHATMEKYYHKEYIPYAEIMNDNISNAAEPILDFIMKRHANAPCLHDAIYAPHAKVTSLGVKNYLVDILSLVSQRNYYQTLQRIRILRGSLEKQSTYLWSHSCNALKQTKIDALKQLEKRIAIDGESPDVAAKEIANQYPIALNGFYSRTRKLFYEIEQTEVISSPNSTKK